MQKQAKLLVKAASLALLAYLVVTCALRRRARQRATSSAGCQQERAQWRNQCQLALEGLGRPELSRYQFSPPTRSIPDELLPAFTQNGAMPVRRYAYVNEAMDTSNPLYSRRQRVISAGELKGWRGKVRKDQALSYNSLALKQTMQKHRAQLTGRSLLVLGSQQPWVEAIGLELDVQRPISTVDHADKSFEQTQDLTWHQVSHCNHFQTCLFARLSFYPFSVGEHLRRSLLNGNRVVNCS